MSDIRFTVVLCLISIINIFAASINFHDFYCWKTQSGKYAMQTPINWDISDDVEKVWDEENHTLHLYAKSRKTTFENVDAIIKWSCEPTTPAAGFLRLKIYEKWESLYLNPRVIDTIKDHEQYTSVIDGTTHAPYTSVTTNHDFTYSVEESSEYVIEQSKLLWDGFMITEPNQYALGN